MTTTSTAHPATARTAAGPLRPFMLLDTGLTAVNALGYLALVPWLPDLLGTPRALVVGAGIFLVLVTGYLVDIVRRPELSRPRIRIQAQINTAWVLASLAYAALGGLTALGVAWVLAQAVVVAVFAALQFRWTR